LGSDLKIIGGLNLNMNTATKPGPTHKRTEGRAPVWGSEFTTQAATLQGAGGGGVGAQLFFSGWSEEFLSTLLSGLWPICARAYGSRSFPDGRARRWAT
jgi:hypothetical protein